MDTVWDSVEDSHSAFVKDMAKLLKVYSYSDKPHAFSTNQKLGEYVILSLRNSKARLFDIVEFLYEIQSEQISKHFEGFRNDLDHLSDVIKVRHFEWEELPEELMDHLLKLDRELIEKVKAIEASVESIYRLSVGFKRTDHKKFDIKEVEKASKGMKKSIRELRVTFEKRSALMDIEGSDLGEEYRRISEEIEKKF